MRKLARVFFEDCLRSFGRWCVEQHNRGHVLSKRFRDAWKLLGQQPHADAGMARWKAEFYWLTCPAFDVFWCGAVIKDDEGVGAFKKETGRFQPKVNIVLLEDDYVQSWVSLCKPVQCLVKGEGRAYEHDIIKLAAESAAELVHKKLRLARVGGANNERVERDIMRVHIFKTAQI